MPPSSSSTQPRAALRLALARRDRRESMPSFCEKSGLQQLIVAVNKLDAVGYDQSRYDEIVAALRPFLSHTGFSESKLTFVPCGAAVGENLQQRSEEAGLSMWYSGPTLVEALDKLEPPQRQLDAPLRMPITNVFKGGQTAISSGVGVSGRLVAGVLSIGDRLSVRPSDESGVCPSNRRRRREHAVGRSWLVLVFEPTLPLLAGTSLELFPPFIEPQRDTIGAHCDVRSQDGAVIKTKPRVLSRGVTAKVRITLAQATPLSPLQSAETWAGLLLRMHGETVAAGIVLETL
ncbi:hypothetical protein L7F22_040815 [Adiantum nelumboides]|nr:hypothetical protein [Adiantum nelumboides]